MIRGVLFDMDGVMIDSERQSDKGWAYSAKVQGEEMPIWLMNGFKGAPRPDCVKMFDEHFKGRLEYNETRRIRTDFVHRLREKEGIPVKPGLKELLDYLKSAGIPCAVATSTEKSSAEKTLHSIGAWDYLSAVVYGDEVEHGKPHPDIFLKAAERIHVNPRDCIVVEDSIHGIRAGHAAGARVIHVPDTIKIKDDVRALTWHVVDTLAEIPALIEAENS
jgi:HAD superfamily hydrolase (TIGR01509 family)